MPQLDTSTWLTVIMTMLPTLYLITQLKLLSTNYHQPPSQKNPNLQIHNIHWQPKWTKIYSPHSQPRQS
uniref:ATP synthase complex subunit 8 n=1 Tax=Lophocebus aterrimus TaxID=75566 RepID=X2J1D5_LOPAT|nr:ATP synthase F0 subunit 8 [Lophocebus aterrimus]